MSTKILNFQSHVNQQLHIDLVSALKDEISLRHTIISEILTILRSNGINPSSCPSIVLLLSDINKQVKNITCHRISEARSDISSSIDVEHLINWTETSL